MRRRHQVVTVGADGQTPNLPMMTLGGRIGPLAGRDLDFALMSPNSDPGCSINVASLDYFPELCDPDWKRARGERHLQRLDVLKLVGVPLFDLLVLPRREEKMSFGDKLEEHDTAERDQVTGEGRAGGWRLWVTVETYLSS